MLRIPNVSYITLSKCFHQLCTPISPFYDNESAIHSCEAKKCTFYPMIFFLNGFGIDSIPWRINSQRVFYWHHWFHFCRSNAHIGSKQRTHTDGEQFAFDNLASFLNFKQKNRREMIGLKKFFKIKNQLWVTSSHARPYDSWGVKICSHELKIQLFTWTVDQFNPCGSIES